MKESAKKTVLNLSIISAISIGITFCFAGLSTNWWAIFLNIVYGSVIGISIAVGSGFISRRVFRRKGFYENPTKHFILAILLVLVFLIVDVIFVNFIWFTITQDVSFSDLFSSVFSVFVMISELIIGLLIYLVALARFFARDLQKYYSRVSDAESQLSKYRYETLKNQLNPHFLFNSLNTLSGLMYVDVDRADTFIHRLSKLYRYILEMQRVEVVPVQTEMELVRDFLYLNNIRFNDQIHTAISVEDTRFYVVPMALQLLIENAIKHNTISAALPLKIEIKLEEEYIMVRNNIQLKLEKEPSYELGLNNLHERYSSLTNKKVLIDRSEMYFTVRVPLLENETE